MQWSCSRERNSLLAVVVFVFVKSPLFQRSWDGDRCDEGVLSLDSAFGEFVFISKRWDHTSVKVVPAFGVERTSSTSL